jgi:hypothetical protein
MHCDEVIRELAAPSDDRKSVAISEHLTACASCAGWAERAVQLDRLWEVTRPIEPSLEAWDTIWAHVVSSLDTAESEAVAAASLPTNSSNGSRVTAETLVIPTHKSARSRPRYWTAIALVGFAQAAAVLLVVGPIWHRFTRSQQREIATATSWPPLANGTLSPEPFDGRARGSVVEIEEGRTVVIHVVGSAATVIDLTPQAAYYRLEKGLRNLESPLVDPWLLMLNEAESMTKPLVAMKE